jgi:hypothetical protein
MQHEAPVGLYRPAEIHRLAGNLRAVKGDFDALEQGSMVSRWAD